jgi:hypothetical protein
VHALEYVQVDIVRQPERLEFAFIMLVSSLYFRTHTNVGLQEEVHEQHNDDDDDIASESYTPSPSLSTSSTVSKRKKKPDTSDLCTTLTKYIASRDKSDTESSTKKKQLTVFLKTLPRPWLRSPRLTWRKQKEKVLT